jgi:hypothetical protein
MGSKNEVLCAAAGRLAAERSEADKPAKAHKIIFAPNNIQGVAQLTPQRKLTCADSNNITGKPDSFLLSAFLIFLEAYQIHQSH